jgi:hypothetical protein
MEVLPDIELVVNTNEVNFKNRGDFETGLKVVNNEDHNLYFDMAKTELFVNGNKNLAWDLTVQNGTIVNFTIGPKSSKTVMWHFGEALFETPGKYELQLRWGTHIRTQEVMVSK